MSRHGLVSQHHSLSLEEGNYVNEQQNKGKNERLMPVGMSEKAIAHLNLF